MKRTTLPYLFILFSCFCPVLAAGADFPNSGISITPLDPKPPKDSPQVLVTFFLAPVDGLAPNVNVLMMPNNPSLKEFVALTRKEFADLKAKVLVDKQAGETGWVFEYTATQNDSEIHFYAKAEHKDGRVYLATATCLESAWEKNAAELKACVESLKSK